MLKFIQFIKEEFLAEAKVNLHGRIDAGGKALGHVRDYIMPTLSAANRAKTVRNLASVGEFKADTKNDGSAHNPKATHTHVLAIKFGQHEAGTKVKVTHVSAGGEDGNNLFAHTESHGKIPLSKLAKPEALRKKPKTTSGFNIESRLGKNLGFKTAGSSSTGIDWGYVAKGEKEPTVRGKVKVVTDRKMVKGVDRPDVRGESKLMRGKFGQSVATWEKGKGWTLTGKNTAVNAKFAQAKITGRDGKERNLIEHLNHHHPNGVLPTGFSTKAASGTASEYIRSSGVNALHIHNLKKSKSTGKIIVNRGTTYTVGKTSLKGKTRLSHLDEKTLGRLDGSVNILRTKTGKAEVTHYPPAGVMRELADNHFNNPEKHRDLTNSDHASEFASHIDRHVEEYRNMQKNK